jgi:CMP-N-acetylneuraminic acid synthetase
MKKIEEVAIIVQARLSSQRVPKKMIRSFAGTTLIDIFLEKVKNSNMIKPENFYLAVHEEELKSIGEKHNVQIFHRSEKSANSEGKPLGDLYEWWNKIPFKYAILINACAPMLKVETIDSFIEEYISSDSDGMFGVTVKKNYFWNEEKEMITPWPEGYECMNTKFVNKTYEAAHCLYAGQLNKIGEGIWMGDFKKPGDISLFEMKEEEVLDIDYEWEFKAYEAVFINKENISHV